MTKNRINGDKPGQLHFNKTAREQADLNGVKLLDQDDLADLLARDEVTTIDVERLLYPHWSAAA